MKILLLGKNGQVGMEAQRALSPLGEVVALGRSAADLSRPETLRAVVRAHQPQVIVNAAAYTAVDKAESEPDLAHCINGIAPGVLAEEAQTANALLIHYSTDYVFDGSGNRPWQENDPVAPLNVYGQSKLVGEIAITQSKCRHLIFRTSWVFSPFGGNFVKTMRRLAREREELRIVADQIGAPTAAHTIADITAHCVRSILNDNRLVDSYSGIYHLASAGETSWHGFAQAIIERAAAQHAVRVDRLLPIASSEYPTPARRPLNSRLDCSKLISRFRLHLPQWEDALSIVDAHLNAGNSPAG